MFEFLERKQPGLSKEEIAKILKASPEALATFEKKYETKILSATPDNVFELNAKQVAKTHEGIPIGNPDALRELISRIVNELLEQAAIWKYDGTEGKYITGISQRDEAPVTMAEISKFPPELRPQLTGHLLKKDTSQEAYPLLFWFLKQIQDNPDSQKAKECYHMFRQGLDVQDLDPYIYEMLGMNQNSMGHWLPQIADAVKATRFFKIPKTTILKVPITMLQLTRLDYESLTRTTLDIVDKFCQKAFELKPDKEYFIKTGTYSSKFDFRNAKVSGENEVRELGEYLLFIQFQASCMAHYDLSGRKSPCIYGVSTTNEWVVRDFIPDVENNPCIYKGMPLHTEYRAFVDFDTKELLGIHPYWDPDVMKKRFGHESDADSPHNIHDYCIYLAHEETLMSRYEENKELVCEQIREMLPFVSGLSGQWSIDIMQNGKDFYLIDMALAQNSAFYECVPIGQKRPTKENWLPNLVGKET